MGINIVGVVVVFVVKKLTPKVSLHQGGVGWRRVGGRGSGVARLIRTKIKK